MAVAIDKSIEDSIQEVILRSCFLSGFEKRTIEGICQDNGIRNPNMIELYHEKAREITRNGIINYEGRLKVLTEDRNGYLSLKEASNFRKIGYYLGRIIGL